MKAKSLLSSLNTLIILSLLASMSLVAPLAVSAQGQNLALGKPVTCSPTPQFPCNEAVDGNLGTRWASAQGIDPQWIYVDLGATTTVTHVILRWETAYGKAYQIQTSNDATNWTDIYSTTTGDGGVDDLTSLSGSGRYVRMNGTVRATQWGYSLWEFEIYGSSGPTDTPVATATPTNTPIPPTATPTSAVSNTGWISPGAQTAQTGGDGNGFQTSPAEALSDNAVFASDVNSGTGSSTSCTNTGKDRHAFHTYNISLPGGSTINGIELRLDARADSTSSAPRMCVELSWNNGTNWTAIKQTGTLGTTEASHILGSATDTWGRTWTTSELTSTTLRVRVTNVSSSTSRDFFLDWAPVRVSYTSGGTPTNTSIPPTATNTSIPPTATNTSVVPTNTPTSTVPPTATNTPSGSCGATNVALSRPVTASSSLGGNTADKAIDGNTTTRWESVHGVDPQWIYVDLGSIQSICQVRLNWEPAYGKSYQIQTSNDASAWTNIFSTTTGDGGIDDLTGLSGSGRYVRMNGTVRALPYGYSLWEYEIYIVGSLPTNTPIPPTATPTQTNTPGPTFTPGGSCNEPNIPNFGPNVRIFEDSMSDASIQALLDADFELLKSTQTAQFAENRRAHLFKPGSYAVFDNVGFYLSVAGLGLNPTDTTIVGAITVDAFNASDAGNATQNFWRSTENLTVNTSGGANRWAVAQAAPFRRMNIIGGLNVFPASFGWASGGYISDSRVTGQVASASQQQWYSKDSNFGSWDGAVWNMVFSGVAGAPAPSFPASPKTVLGTTPVSRDVPYLYVDASGNYRVFLPSLRTNASGASWPNTPGTSLPMSQFYVVQTSDSAGVINSALNAGCNLFFPPGIYHINQTININNANTVVLGIGYPTIVNDNGVVAMQVADVDGVRLKGLLFDAGLTNAPAQVIVGTQGNTTSHASNPVTIQDVFFRIGGQFAGKVTTSLIVNSYDTIIDHIWAWRADHGSGVGWTANTTDTGLIVNGNNVLATGLFVEHYQKYQVIWNGQNGKTIFFQNEIGYDQPNQAAWMNGSTRGYAAYKVADTVTTHEAWGVASYIFMNVDTSIWCDRAFEVPNTPNVKFHNVSTVSLGNAGMIQFVINNTGATTPTNSTPATVTNYP